MFIPPTSQQMYDHGYLVLSLGGTQAANAFDFGSEAIATISSTVSARASSIPFNSSTKGYLAGGITAATFNLIDGLRFADASGFTSSATLSHSQYGGHGVSSALKGYVAGGQDDVGVLTSIDALVFSTDALSTIAATISSTVTREPGGFGNFTQGYATCLSGGEVEKLTYATEAVTGSIATGFGSGTIQVATFNSPLAGYAAGCSSIASTRIDKLVFSSDTTSTLTATLSAARGAAGGSLNTGAKGYVCGGYNQDTATSSAEIDGIEFSGETAINPAAALSTAERWVGVQGGWL